MRTLIASLVALFYLSAGPVVAEDGPAKNAMSCSALYFVASSLVLTEKDAANLFVSIQVMFDGVYAAFEEQRLGQPIATDMITEIKSQEVLRLGDLYEQEPNQMYALEMQCNEWRNGIFPYLVELIESDPSDTNGNAIMLNIPQIPMVPEDTNPRWDQSRYLVDSSFAKWNELGRITPLQLR
ncbi:MAG: hypothetical protein CMM32_01315 [Rhodospirillaceae bacterium]|nr:hypothetical protein [Rhodospirillaceae bacterium]|tara:strand:- start:4 stop:549 length:546 start_codon:yes stop_codon:yes gene_type:complete